MANSCWRYGPTRWWHGVVGSGGQSGESGHRGTEGAKGDNPAAYKDLQKTLKK